jgi:GT2 family glycosyltransferase
MSLAVPNRGEPVVSVLMAAHGGWPLTRQAIAAIIEHTEPAFELIVVDNASPDETGRRLGEIAGLRLMRNRENRGFGPANNQAAAQARGEFLFFLNAARHRRKGSGRRRGPAAVEC